MATNESELKTEVREFTQYPTDILDADGLNNAYKRAKRHIRARKDLASGFGWYDTVQREDALFWWTCLFAKVVVGEVDAGSLRISEIEVEALDEEETSWYRNAERAMRNFDSGGTYPHGMGITSPTRDDRVYGEEDTGTTL